MGIDEEVHGTGEPQGQLDHVQNGLVLVEPHVMIRDRHGLESNRFGVLEERIRSPHILQPLHLQQPVPAGHILWQSQSIVLPRLRKEDVRRICLKWV